MFGQLYNQPLPLALLIILAFQLARYFLVAGSAFLVFWVAFRNAFAAKKIDPNPIKRADIFREIRWSLLTMLIFLIPGALVLHLRREGLSQLYTDFDSHGGWSWFLLSLGLMFVVHDLYFYLIHRMMHHPWFYRHFHDVHHRSLNPTPWAAFSFHPLEALLESGVIYLFIFLIPLHVAALFIFQLLSLVMNVYGHLGYDLAPSAWASNPVLKYWNTTRNHHWHHQRFNGNYGLYTTIWDRVLGTYHAR